MLYRVAIALLLLLVGYGMWSLSQNCSYWIPERKINLESVSRETPIPATPASRSQGSEPSVPESPPPRISPVEPIAESKPLSQSPQLVLLDQRVRESIFRQQAVPIPLSMERLVDATGHEYRQVSIVRLEPDGIHIRHMSGLEKIDFARLPTDLKERYFIEAELALRYREVIEKRSRVAERKRQEKMEELEEKRKEHILWNTPAVSVKPARAPAVQKLDRCEMCKGLFPAEQMKTYQALFRPKDKVRRSVNCCPSCVPYSIRNIADPYMPR